VVLTRVCCCAAVAAVEIGMMHLESVGGDAKLRVMVSNGLGLGSQSVATFQESFL